MSTQNQPRSIEILPLKGLNVLEFGCDCEKALSILGEPEEKETLKDDVLNADSEVFHYWEKGISLFFNRQSGLKLTCIEVDCADATLFGKLIFELSEKKIIELFRENKFEVTETETHDWGEKRVSFDDALMDLYFENGKLISINFGFFPDEPSFYFFPN